MSSPSRRLDSPSASPSPERTLSRRALARTGLLAVTAPALLAACGIHREGDEHPPRDDAGSRTLKLLQSGARYAMATARARGSDTQWVEKGLKEQIVHLKGITGVVQIDESKVLQPTVNGDVATALMASVDAMLPRLHEAGDDLAKASDMVAWWIGAAHVVDPRAELPSLPNDIPEQAAETLGDLHEVTWACQVLTTRLGPDARVRSLRNIGHLQEMRQIVDTLAGDAGPAQEIAYRMPREVLDRENRADRFAAFLDPWAKHLREQILEHGDDQKRVHLLTAQLGVAVGLQMDWNKHSTPSVPQDSDR